MKSFFCMKQSAFIVRNKNMVNSILYSNEQVYVPLCISSEYNLNDGWLLPSLVQLTPVFHKYTTKLELFLDFYKYLFKINLIGIRLKMYQVTCLVVFTYAVQESLDDWESERPGGRRHRHQPQDSTAPVPSPPLSSTAQNMPPVDSTLYPKVNADFLMLDIEGQSS